MLTEVEVGPWANEWRLSQEVWAGLQKQNSKINKNQNTKTWLHLGKWALRCGRAAPSLELVSSVYFSFLTN